MLIIDHKSIYVLYPPNKYASVWRLPPPGAPPGTVFSSASEPGSVTGSESVMESVAEEEKMKGYMKITRADLFSMKGEESNIEQYEVVFPHLPGEGL